MSSHIEWGEGFEAELHDPGDPEHPDLVHADGWEPSGNSFALTLWLTGQDSAAVVEYGSAEQRRAAVAGLARLAGVTAADLAGSEDLANFRVTWSIDVDASSPRDAAWRALDALQRPGSIAHVFDVTPADYEGHSVRVDLDDEPEVGS